MRIKAYTWDIPRELAQRTVHVEVSAAGSLILMDDSGVLPQLVTLVKTPARFARGRQIAANFLRFMRQSFGRPVYITNL